MADFVIFARFSATDELAICTIVTFLDDCITHGPGVTAGLFLCIHGMTNAGSSNGRTRCFEHRDAGSIPAPAACSEGIRLDEETVLKTVAGHTVQGSSPCPSARFHRLSGLAAVRQRPSGLFQEQVFVGSNPTCSTCAVWGAVKPGCRE